MTHLVIIAAFFFPDRLEEKEHLSWPKVLSVFLRMKNEGKPHQEKVRGDIFQHRTKVPFMGKLGRRQELPVKGEKVSFAHHSLFF